MRNLAKREQTMDILNIAGYQFITLNTLPDLQNALLSQCQALELKGTILLSNEGININLAGYKPNVRAFQYALRSDSRFKDISFHESYSASIPFKRLKVKIKNEIITFRKEDAISSDRAPAISPQEFKQWLDEKRDITILDTRNDYEIRFGTFAGAKTLDIQHFDQLPEHLAPIDKDKPIVMFCTGGIRCEKAATHMLNQGYTSVYQLDGGILGYFAKVGGEHYEGECFIFDERLALNSELKATTLRQCLSCQGPIPQETKDHCKTCMIT